MPGSGWPCTSQRLARTGTATSQKMWNIASRLSCKLLISTKKLIVSPLLFIRQQKCWQLKTYLYNKTIATVNSNDHKAIHCVPLMARETVALSATIWRCSAFMEWTGTGWTVSMNLGHDYNTINIALGIIIIILILINCSSSIVLSLLFALSYI